MATNRTNPIIRFLQRPGAHETWVYERRVILTIELLCQFALVLVAPTHRAQIVLLMQLPFSMLAVELARSSRSGAARKAEHAAAMGMPSILLHCERQLVRDTKRAQWLSGMAPIVGLVSSIVTTPIAAMVWPAVVTCTVSLMRWALVEDYARWRSWYREKAPLSIKHQAPAGLVETKPFDSGQMARAVEQALKDN